MTYDREDDDSRSYQRVLSQQEFDRLKNFLAENNVNDMKAFVGCSSGCRPHELLMLGRAGGRRVFSLTDDEPEFFEELDEFFERLKAEPGQLRYAAAEKLPGFQILFADERLPAQTVWADGDDVRFYAIDVAARTSVEKEIADETERYFSSLGESETFPDYRFESRLTEKRRHDGTAWYKYTPQGIGTQAAQPLGVEAIPLRTGQKIEALDPPWKSRGGGVELRSDGEALYKVSGGNVIKIAEGNFLEAVVSSDGRWAAARIYDDETGMKLVRIDLVSRRQYDVVFDGRMPSPVVWVSGVNKFLLANPVNDYYEEYLLLARRDPKWLDPVSGKVTDASGMVEPLLQQTFRPLQKASVGGYWAAMPDKKTNETKVGLYDAMAMKFTPKITIPSIQFSSMEMWVDEKTSFVYFVYDGHVIRVPMPK